MASRRVKDIKNDSISHDISQKTLGKIDSRTKYHFYLWNISETKKFVLRLDHAQATYTEGSFTDVSTLIV